MQDCHMQCTTAGDNTKTDDDVDGDEADWCDGDVTNFSSFGGIAGADAAQ